jgi:hypothetical protein
MRANRPGTKARNGQPWCCPSCEQSDGPIAGDPLRISEICAGTGSLASAFRQLAQAGELRRAYTVVQSVGLGDLVGPRFRPSNIPDLPCPALNCPDLNCPDLNCPDLT